MRVLIDRRDDQLARLETSIAAFKSRSAVEQSRMGILLAALEREKAAVLACHRPSMRTSPALLAAEHS